MVVTALPATLETCVMQERTASPLMCTVQAPHSAMPHPNLVPVIPSVSRNTHSSGISGLASTVCGLPFNVNLMDAIETPQLRMSLTEPRPCGSGTYHGPLPAPN